MTRREWDEIWAGIPAVEARQLPLVGLVLIPGQRNRVSALDDLVN